ncbi:MAG: universal stress protein [Thermococci archaeon]|nr:universal stress protein [Thermococci archaeon]
MFRRVLYPTDFSELSLGVLSEYIPCMRELGAESFLLLHVVDITSADFEAFKIQKALEERLKRVAEKLGKDVEAEVRIGIPSIEIGEAADEWGADLVVLPSAGENVWRLSFIGNTASNMCRITRRPVLVLKHSEEGVTVRCRELFKRPLVALDFSECSIRIIETVKKFEEHVERGVLLHSIDYGGKSELEENVKKAKERLTKSMEAFSVPFDIEVTVGSASKAIRGTAVAKDSTVIVIGKKGKSFLKNLLLGSTAERVLRDSKIPVLLVPCEK